MKQPISRMFLATACVVIVALSGCASGGAQINQPLTMAGFALTRAVADVEIGKALKDRGMSDAEVADTITELRAITDALIAGEGLQVVFEARWVTVRADAIDQFSGLLAGLKVDGVQAFDDAGARALVTPLVDAFAAQVRTAIGGKHVTAVRP